jgi:membrane-bound lytic murein transglycosylase A
MSLKKNCLILLILLMLNACSSTPVVEKKIETSPSTNTQTKATHCPCEQSKPSVTSPTAALPEEKKPLEAPTQMPKIPEYSLLKASSWESMDGFNQENLSLAWPAWQQSCSALKNKATWRNVCVAAQKLDVDFASKPSDTDILNYFKTHFSVYQATNIDGTDTGMITGYYEPQLKGSRTQSAQFPYPLYTTPPDLISVALDEIYPELKFKRLRGRLNGNKLVPYFNRAEIEAENSPIARQAFVYVSDKIDLFFLQIQGSGLITLENGEQMHVGYADQNGHTYQSIGKFLIANGELTPSEASMQGIKLWASKNPEKLQALLNQNPSYVFFRELPAGLPGPLGALGVPLLAEYAVAVDPKMIPLGAPVFLSTTMPNSVQPLKKIVMAQDTGGAIKGGVRADFFWGSGNAAGEKAGAMKQSGKIWVLLPKDFVIQQNNFPTP